MPIVKKRNQQTESRLLLESGEPVELPPAEVDERALLVQFDQFRPFIPELLKSCARHSGRARAEGHGSTFAINGDTRPSGQTRACSRNEMTRIDSSPVRAASIHSWDANHSFLTNLKNNPSPKGQRSNVRRFAVDFGHLAMDIGLRVEIPIK